MSRAPSDGVRFSVADTRERAAGFGGAASPQGFDLDFSFGFYG